MRSKLTTAFVALATLFFGKMYAQPGLEWQHGFGASGYETVLSTTADAAGNVYVAGFYFGTVDFNPSTAVSNLSSKGDKDAFIVKYSPTGAFVWARGFGTSLSTGATLYDEAKALSIDPNGNLIVGGVFQGDTCYLYNATTTLATIYGNGNEDVLVAKFAANGNILFAKNIGSGDTERFGDLDVDQNGNIYLTGHFYGTTDLDPGPGVTAYTSYLDWMGDNSADIYLIKLTNNGQFVFGYRLGGHETDYGSSLDVTNNGEVYFTGTFATLCDFNAAIALDTLHTTSNSTADLDSYLCKYDTAGNFVWVRQIGGSGSQFGYGLAADDNGKVFVGGIFGGTTYVNEHGANVDTLTSSGINDIFVTSFNSQGNLLWANKIGGASSDVCSGLAIDNASNVYITGSFYSFSMDFDPSPAQMVVSRVNIATTNTDMYLAKYNSAGHAIWARGFGDLTSGNEEGNAIAIAPNSNAIILVGESNGTSVDFDPTSLNSIFTSNGSIDGFVAKYSACSLNRTIGKDSLVLQVDAGYQAYQWINCATNLPVVGATQNIFNPTQNGDYAVIITGSEGCVDTTDCMSITSVIECNLNVTIAQKADTLMASEANATYQWVVCPTNGVISGATSQYYIPSINASYACKVTTSNGCIYTTPCFAMTDVSVNDQNYSNAIIIAPNPANNVLNVSIQNCNNFSVSVTDLAGKDCKIRATSNNANCKINVENLAKGTYILKLQNLNNNTFTFRKFVKE